MRAWFNGRMEASQALDEGSIPFARFFIRIIMENENLDLDVKPVGNKDLWLFLILVDVLLMCVLGFFIYRQVGDSLFRPAVELAQTTAEQQPQPTELPAVEKEETVAAPEVLPAKDETPAAAPVEEKAAEPEKSAKQDKPAKQSVFVGVNPKSQYRRVKFRWYGEGKKVEIVSGFTMSKPQPLKKKDGYWETTLSILPGTYKFLYVIDGVKVTDPYSPQQGGRSVLEIK